MRNYPIQRQRLRPDWEYLLVELTATILAFGVIALAAWLICWSFYIPYHWRYSVGAIAAVIMLKWLAPNLKTKENQWK